MLAIAWQLSLSIVSLITFAYQYGSLPDLSVEYNVAALDYATLGRLTLTIPTQQLTRFGIPAIQLSRLLGCD